MKTVRGKALDYCGSPCTDPPFTAPLAIAVDESYVYSGESPENGRRLWKLEFSAGSFRLNAFTYD